MKSVLTARGSFPTGTELADAVLAYGSVLARVDDVDLVDIPFLQLDGTVGRVSFPVGVGIELAVITAVPRDDELFEPGTLLDILDKTRALRRISTFTSRPATLPGWAGSGQVAPGWDDSDWDDVI